MVPSGHFFTCFMTVLMDACFFLSANSALLHSVALCLTFRFDSLHAMGHFRQVASSGQVSFISVWFRFFSPETQMSKLEYCLYSKEGWLLTNGREYPPEQERGMVVKALLLGNTSVGRSTFLCRLQTGSFPLPSLSYTVAAEFAIKVVSSSRGFARDDVKLQMWDAMSLERYPTITNAYYRNATIFLFCFEHKTEIYPTPPNKWSGFPPLEAAVDDAFDSIRSWISEFSGASSPIEFPLVPVVVGMKSDLLEGLDEKSILKALGQEPTTDSRGEEDRLQTDFPDRKRSALDRYLQAFTQSMERRVKTFIEEELGVVTVFPVRCLHTSSKTGSGVDELLQYVADTMHTYRIRGPNKDQSRAGAVRLPSLVNHSTSSGGRFTCSVG
jgi:GTPase SAR1 family protein